MQDGMLYKMHECDSFNMLKMGIIHEKALTHDFWFDMLNLLGP